MQAGLTPLLVAATHGDLALMKALIEAKADQAAQDPLGNTALVLADSETAAAAGLPAATQRS